MVALRSITAQLRARETHVALQQATALPRDPRIQSLTAEAKSVVRHATLPSSLRPSNYFATRLRSLPHHAQHLLLAHTGCVNAVAISEGEGRFIATGGDDLRVLLWDAYAPVRAVHPTNAARIDVHEPSSLDAPPATAASSISHSSRRPPRAGFIASPFTQSYTGHSANIFGLTFSPDMRHIISCGLDAQIHCYDLQTGGGDSRQPSNRSFRGHQSSVHRVSFQAGSDNVFLSASNDHTVRLWDLRANNQAQFVGGFSYSLNSVHCSPVDPYTFCTAGRSLCLHDLRRLHPTAHNVDAAQASHATPRQTRAATRRHNLATELAERTRYVLESSDGDANDEMSAMEDDAEEEDDEDEADSYRSLIEFLITGGGSSRAKPIATLFTFDTTTSMPHAPVLSSISSTKRGTRRSSKKSSSSTRGRGAGRGRLGRSRGRATAVAAASTATSSTRTSRSRTRAAAEEEKDGEEKEHETGSRSRRPRTRSRSGSRRRSTSAITAPPVAEPEAESEASSDEEEDEEMIEEISPKERFVQRRDVSSAEYSADGRFIAVCMMEGQPALYQVGRTDPLLSFQSVYDGRGDFSGYSNTCTMKSVVFAGPDDRFVVGGSDNFGIYVWDRKCLPQDVLASPETNPANKATFVNACHIIRGHRSVPNNARYHPRLMQLYSCGVEKVVRAFQLTRPAVEILGPDGTTIEDGDILPSRVASKSPHKRKTPASEEDEDAQPSDEKKSRSESSATSTCDANAPVGAAASSESSRPRRRAAVAADAAITAGSAHRRRSARHRSSSPPTDASSASAAAASAASINTTAATAAAAPKYDPLYRMVHQYMQPRQPYSRLQCSFILSGGSEWNFNAATSMFNDALDEPLSDAAELGEMAEDRECMAQFDWYFLKAAAGEPDSDEDSEGELEASESDEEEDSSSSDSSPATMIELTTRQMQRLREALQLAPDAPITFERGEEGNRDEQHGNADEADQS